MDFMLVLVEMTRRALAYSPIPMKPVFGYLQPVSADGPLCGQSQTGFSGPVSGGARFKQMAYRTEQSYVDWIRRFIVWSGQRHPREMGTVEVRGFLTHLAVERNVAAATQNQALNALVFLYREVISGELRCSRATSQPKRGERLPEVLSRAGGP